MTTVQITLPDQLAQEAQRAGLLAPARLEQWCTKLHRADQQIGVIRINIELSHQGQRLF